MARGAIFLLVGMVAMAICVVVSGRIISARTNAPSDVGLTSNGNLHTCTARANCVASDASPGPLPLTFTSDARVAQQRLIKLIRDDGGEVRVQEANYVAAVYRSTVFGFPDDVEFLIDTKTNTISWRSASRLGRGDFGVNNDRMKRIAAKWARR